MKLRLVLFMVLCLAALPLVAQQLTGDLIVEATDPSNAVMPGAKVTISSPALIRPVEGTTDNNGMFYGRNLPSGTYKITVSKDGFTQTLKDNVAVEVGKTYTIPMPLN